MVPKLTFTSQVRYQYHFLIHVEVCARSLQRNPVDARRGPITLMKEIGMAFSHERLEAMKGGWFVGNFAPTVYSTTVAEIAVKHYRAGNHEAAHYHRIATEITVVVTGQIEMVGRIWQTGDIISLEPGEVTDFRAVSDATTVVVKLPGANNDKYLLE